ncbi:MULTISPECIES: single-stranded DNA-binding protein [unclassified Actinomyces]|uniref:single-stranded DNA-binding protein n=1 Tax=unclassified Actinomyces TaxID=2609248 RepID=UPI0020175427|nr:MULTISPECIES: single-stranded DNA-binding protein [unclassified Actinomyces]MCL3776789.1 single-stranded DNA-binding protein [Actinomyces sp. AC-20-1]MCL3789883.1 single-stranded DNA-binding protein [Actinomyces sp. 187325]MCL3792220.1 single-stranded DNA-binding protein [Actinomyces sp. 186855]MCL3794782.1 single-stranded DNA-binding protein [Actinomyces sp. 217892]
MSRQIDLTVQGVVGTTPTIAITPSRRVYCRFRVASTPAYRDAGGQWHDDETLWFTAKAWGPLAENLARSLRKGDPVLLQGRLTQETWQPEDGPAQTSNVITVTAGGHDLGRGTSTYMRVEPVMGSARSAATPQSAPSADSAGPTGAGAGPEPGAGTGSEVGAGPETGPGTGTEPVSTDLDDDPWPSPLAPPDGDGFSDAELSYEAVNA